jgi:hypothetical protein
MRIFEYGEEWTDDDEELLVLPHCYTAALVIVQLPTGASYTVSATKLIEATEAAVEQREKDHV